MSEVRTANATPKSEKRRRLSFADDYAGGKLTDVTEVTNNHYSNNASARQSATRGGADNGVAASCCLIS